MREEEKDAIAKPPAVRVKAIPKAFCDSRKSYVLLGGLGGFGLETAGWLIERGAKNIVITSRSGITNGYQSRKIRMWREAGVNVVLSNLNVIKYDDTVAILKEALKLGPVGGIFHLAMVSILTNDISMIRKLMCSNYNIFQMKHKTFCI